MIFRRLILRVFGWQLLMSLLAAAAIAAVPRYLLLLPGPPGAAAERLLVGAVLSSALFALAPAWGLLRSRRGLLGELERGQHPLDQIHLPKLNDDPWFIVNGWVLCTIGFVVLSMTALRWTSIPPSAALTLTLFAGIIVAALSLPLLILIRADFVRLVERVPPDVMADIIDAQVRSGRLRGRTSRRLMSAIVTPVAFLSIGSALIAGAHVRSGAESATLATAALAARVALDGRELEGRVSAVGAPLGSALDRQADLALSALSRHGFRARLVDREVDELRAELHHGLVSVLVPLSRKGVELEYFQSSEWPIDFSTIAWLILAVLSAGVAGLSLGRLLSRDLRMANRGVLTLGTDAALEGTRVMRPTRFRVVVELGEAIELLSSRFRLFAQAQERSIAARESATRSRGRFLASVSHDLKSPLNSILGFAELCQRDPDINAQQRESLDLIVQGGRELLALIETILDAARVEAGQLKLEFAEVGVASLLEAAIKKARELSGSEDTMVLIDIPADVPSLVADEMRLSRALATLIGHALRTAERSSLRILVESEAKSPVPSLKRRKVTVHVEVPSTRYSAQELEAMLSPERHPGQHRGEALALRLAKSVLELHGGQLKVLGRTVSEPAFAVELRARAGV